MTLRLTPDMLAAAYDFLRATEPFRGWKLPEAEEVGFHILKTRSHSADYSFENGVHLIRISAARNGHAASLIATMAHEMVHLRQQMLGDRGHHTTRFRKMAARVCRVHGFDPKTF
jgi:hypothetical protein